MTAPDTRSACAAAGASGARPAPARVGAWLGFNATEGARRS